MINVDEILSILQEECAEVIQAVSKVNRFGMTGMNPKDNKNNQYHLEEEIGDLTCMIELLIENGIVNKDNIDSAAINKRVKLRKWSTIFLNNNIPNQ
jgi:NTP pyrophosphatase (non-canonical NTP hydrolase)